jgi:hypothetical protein
MALLGGIVQSTSGEPQTPIPTGLQTQRAARGHRQERRRSGDERFPHVTALRRAARHQGREKSQPRAAELTRPRREARGSLCAEAETEERDNDGDDGTGAHDFFFRLRLASQAKRHLIHPWIRWIPGSHQIQST